VVLLVHRDALFDLATHHLALLRAVLAWLASKIGDPDAVTPPPPSPPVAAAEEEEEEEEEGQGPTELPANAAAGGGEIRQRAHRRSVSDNPFGSAASGSARANPFAGPPDMASIADDGDEQQPQPQQQPQQQQQQQQQQWQRSADDLATRKSE
jgi:hypothetical protein